MGEELITEDRWSSSRVCARDSEFDQLPQTPRAASLAAPWGNARELWLDISEEKELITKQRQHSAGVRESHSATYCSVNSGNCF